MIRKSKDAFELLAFDGVTEMGKSNINQSGLKLNDSLRNFDSSDRRKKERVDYKLEKSTDKP